MIVSEVLDGEICATHRMRERRWQGGSRRRVRAGRFESSFESRARARKVPEESLDVIVGVERRSDDADANAIGVWFTGTEPAVREHADETLASKDETHCFRWREQR